MARFLETRLAGHASLCTAHGGAVFFGSISAAPPAATETLAALVTAHAKLALVCREAGHRRFDDRLGAGDRVTVQLSPFDVARGRITFRHPSRRRQQQQRYT